MSELRGADQSLRSMSLLGKLDPVDLVLIEGYKRDSHPKIETFRSARLRARLLAPK